MRKLLCTLFLGLFLAACLGITPAFADDQADKRFHDAYLAEVVDGKIAASAKVYLALMNDDATPKRLRMEAQFRFAVCATLLGRADEARSQFDALLASDAPEAVKTRAREYRKGITGVAAGSEATRQMDALVMELAKLAPGNRDNAARSGIYRQFQVMGAAAVPYLKRLLTHRDLGMRTHAFRTLLRMFEPGLMAQIPKGLHLPDMYELGEYVMRLPNERTALETMALKSPGIRMATWTPTPEFLVEYVKRDNAKHHAVKLAGRKPMTDARMSLLTTWARSDDVNLRRAALSNLLANHGNKAPLDLFVPAVANEWIDLRERKRNGGYAKFNRSAVEVWAARIEAPQALGLLEVLLEEALHFSAKDSQHPLGRSSNLVMQKLDQATLDAPQLEHLEALTRAWIANADAFGNKSNMGWFLLNVSRALPLKQGVELTRWACEQGHSWTGSYNSSDRDVALLMAAVKALPKRARVNELRYLPVFEKTVKTSDLRSQQLDTVFEVLKETTRGSDVTLPMSELARHASESDDAATQLRDLFERSCDLPAATQKDAHHTLVVSNNGMAFFLEWGEPLVRFAGERFNEAARKDIVNWAAKTLSRNASDWGHAAELRKFVLAHADDLSQKSILGAAGVGEQVVPYRVWIPRMPSGSMRQYMGPRRDVDWDKIATELLASNPSNANVVEIAINRTKARQAFANQLITHADASVRRYARHELSDNGKPASGTALETALSNALARSPIDFEEVSALVRNLLIRSPSTRLLPAVRALLASNDLLFVDAGISAAKGLGTEVLMPDLRKLLFSMHGSIRTRAKETIDYLNELIVLRGKPTEPVK